MMTSREFKALEKGKIITKISIYGSEGNLLKTVPLEQAKVHKCITNHNSRDFLFTMEEAERYIELGIADAFATIHGEKNFVHCIHYIDRAYGKLTHQSMMMKLSIEQAKENNRGTSKNI